MATDLATYIALSARVHGQPTLDPAGQALYDAAAEVWSLFEVPERLWWLTRGQHQLYCTADNKSVTKTGMPMARAGSRSATTVPPLGVRLIQRQVWGNSVEDFTLWKLQDETDRQLLKRVTPWPIERWTKAAKAGLAFRRDKDTTAPREGDVDVVTAGGTANPADLTDDGEDEEDAAPDRPRNMDKKS